MKTGSALRTNRVDWEEFKRADPELTALGEERMEATGLVLLGTLRKNGFPRISPVEPLLTMGRLYLGMMWQSRKALDLLRDPRCTVHSTVSDRHGSREGLSCMDVVWRSGIWKSGVSTVRRFMRRSDSSRKSRSSTCSRLTSRARLTL